MLVTLGVNVATKINVFLPRVNASVDALASTLMLGVNRPLQFFKLLELVVMDTDVLLHHPQQENNNII